MSLSEQIQRVDGSQNDIIKALAQSYGISTDSLKIDQVASAVKSSQKFKQDGLLSAATAALFGLTTDAVPDDVLQLLANNLYNGLGNQYVWGKYLPTYDTENVNEVVLAIKSNNTGTTFTYADSVSFDYDTGVIQFPEGSTTVTVWSYDFKTFDFTVLRGKYQIGGDGVNATWCRKFSVSIPLTQMRILLLILTGMSTPRLDSLGIRRKAKPAAMLVLVHLVIATPTS